MLMSDDVRMEEHSLFSETPKQLLMVAILAFVAVFLPPEDARAQGAERSGKEVVDAGCISCHGTGANGAPKIGDHKAWAKRASRGLTALTESALKGIRNMPAHGGNLALSDIEIERAITYMVNQSGGRWAEPISGVTPAVERKGKQVVEARCANCHQTGKEGAPKIGDRAAWTPRLKQGLDFLVRSAINGHGPMPPRGGMTDLTESEIRGAIVYMFNPGSGSAKAPSAARATAPDSNHKVVGGTEIYLGIVAAESMRAQHPKADAESKMHGGIPSGKGYYHVNISLLDSNTKAEIKDAQVEVRIATPLTGETKKLEPMVINNTVSYGNYFRMPGKDPYTITVKIRGPGTSRAIEAKFDYKH